MNVLERQLGAMVIQRQAIEIETQASIFQSRVTPARPQRRVAIGVAQHQAVALAHQTPDTRQRTGVQLHLQLGRVVCEAVVSRQHLKHGADTGLRRFPDPQLAFQMRAIAFSRQQQLGGIQVEGIVATMQHQAHVLEPHTLTRQKRQPLLRLRKAHLSFGFERFGRTRRSRPAPAAIFALVQVHDDAGGGGAIKDRRQMAQGGKYIETGFQMGHAQQRRRLHLVGTKEVQPRQLDGRIKVIHAAFKR